MPQLTADQIARALRDADYRATLSDDERAQLPDNPAGPLEISEDGLSEVAGGVEAEIGIDLTDQTLCVTCIKTIGGGCGWGSFGRC